MNAVVNITPVNERAKLGELAQQIQAHEEEIAEIREAIKNKYRAAEALGCPKAGFRLVIAHARLEAEKFEHIQRGYRVGADALGLQMDLFGA